MKLATYPYGTVNGVEVLAAENADSPLPHKGQPYRYQNIFNLLLATGETIAGCGVCPFTHASIHGIRAHMKVHLPPTCECGHPRRQRVVHSMDGCHERDKYRKEGMPLPTEEIQGIIEMLNSVPSLQAKIDSLEVSRDTWRARAETAEQKLAEIQQAIKAMAG